MFKDKEWTKNDKIKKPHKLDLHGFNEGNIALPYLFT